MTASSSLTHSLVARNLTLAAVRQHLIFQTTFFAYGIRIGPSSLRVFRRRQVPTRRVGEQLILARPRDGQAVALNESAHFLWNELEHWRNADELVMATEASWPAMSDAKRRDAVCDLLDMLAEEDLIERT